MGAKKKPLETLSAADAGVDAGQVGESGAHSVVRSVAPPAAKSAGVTIEDSGGDSAGQVVELLAGKGLI
jgi:electron transfer flavoprotein beta subunit